MTSTARYDGSRRGAGQALALAAALCCTGPVAAGEPPAEAGSGADGGVARITADGLMETVDALTSPEMDGRLAGTAGHERAADWAAARFAELGLQPGGDDGGYLQTFACEVNEIAGEPTLAVVTGGDDDRFLRHGTDFVVRGFTGSGHGAAIPVVFAGYGISLPERGWDDFAGVDVDGAVVLAFKQAPPWTLEDGGWGDAASPRVKAREAAARGAVGLLLVSRPLDDPPQPLIGSVAHGPGEHPAGTPQFQVTVAVADALLGWEGAAASWQELIDRFHRPYSRLTPGTVTFAVEARHDPRGTCANVVAVLPGADRARAGEHVIVGAHLDHVGRQGPLLYPGANDNASGSAAVLAAAAALSHAAAPPSRSVVFVLFDAEEQGLFGSQAYVAAPARPLDTAAAMLNADCIGLGDGLQIGGGGAHPVLWTLARELDRAGDALSVEETWYGGGADAQAFFDAGVPTLYFATTHSYAQLHRPGDTAQTLDPALLTGVARLLYRTAAAVAAGDYDRQPRQPAPGADGAG